MINHVTFKPVGPKTKNFHQSLPEIRTLLKEQMCRELCVFYTLHGYIALYNIEK